MTTFIRKSLERKRQLLDNGEKGFTLIELLVVVLIIGVLAAIAIPIYLTTQETAKDNAVKSSVTEAKTALVAYYTTNGSMPATIDQLSGYSPGADITIRIADSTSLEDFCIEAAYGPLATGTHPYHVTQDGSATTALCPAG